MSNRVSVFRVHPRHASRLYFTVRVFDSVRELRKDHSSRVNQAAGYYRRALGACSAWTDRRCGEFEVGIISLWRKRLGAEIVSHECVHAALACVDRKGIRSIVTKEKGSDDAEALCYAAGYLTREVYNGLYAAGIL